MAMSAWVDGPFPLIETPSRTRDVVELSFIHALVHQSSDEPFFLLSIEISFRDPLCLGNVTCTQHADPRPQQHLSTSTTCQLPSRYP